MPSDNPHVRELAGELADGLLRELVRSTAARLGGVASVPPRPVVVIRLHRAIAQAVDQEYYALRKELLS